MTAIGLGEECSGSATKASRDILWASGAASTPVYDGAKLAAGSVTAGPAILEFPDTTIVIDRDCRASIHSSGSVVIDIDQPVGAQ